MTHAQHTTAHIAAPDRATHWQGVISEAYFPLDLTFRDAARFRGALDMRCHGDVALSRLRTQALHYERHRHHISATTQEQYLITIPLRAPVEFRQLGREVRCNPGGFLLERGDEPYRFSYAAANDLCVLKVAKTHLAERLRSPDRFCARVFDGQAGLGGLFTAMARQMAQVVIGPDAAPGAGAVLGRQLIELLALSLDQTSDDGSAVRAAHLMRARAVIARNLGNPDLSPAMVAEACGISTRYLHALFADQTRSVAQTIRDARLIAARDRLQMPTPEPLSDLAYRFGFSDQAQFSRLFKAMFGQTPSRYRASLARNSLPS